MSICVNLSGSVLIVMSAICCRFECLTVSVEGMIKMSKHHLFLVAKSNSIRGFVRRFVGPSVGPWFRPSVGHAFLKNSKFKTRPYKAVSVAYFGQGQ